MFCFFANLIALSGLSFTGFGLYLMFNTYAYRTYGDHCGSGADCQSNMNYVCKSNLCTCAPNTYFVQMGSPCGKIYAAINICSKNRLN